MRCELASDTGMGDLLSSARAGADHPPASKSSTPVSGDGRGRESPSAGGRANTSLHCQNRGRHEPCNAGYPLELHSRPRGERCDLAQQAMRPIGLYGCMGDDSLSGRKQLVGAKLLGRGGWTDHVQGVADLDCARPAYLRHHCRCPGLASRQIAFRAKGRR